MQSYSWPSSEGSIIESKLIDDGLVTHTVGSFARQYSSLIKYDYQVGLETFQSEKVSLFPLESSLSKKAMDRLLMKYPVGRSVKIYYDPIKPNEAVLEKGLNIRTPFALIAMLIFNGLILTMILRP